MQATNGVGHYCTMDYGCIIAKANNTIPNLAYATLIRGECAPMHAIKRSYVTSHATHFLARACLLGTTAQEPDIVHYIYNACTWFKYSR